MAKLILMSVYLVPILIGLVFARLSKPRLGLRRTILAMVLFCVLWGYLGPILYENYDPLRYGIPNVD